MNTMNSTDFFKLDNALQNSPCFVTLKKYPTANSGIFKLWKEYHIGDYTIGVCDYYKDWPHVHKIDSTAIVFFKTKNITRQDTPIACCLVYGSGEVWDDNQVYKLYIKAKNILDPDLLTQDKIRE